MAYPVGGPGAEFYALVEMHYDNPNLDQGKLNLNCNEIDRVYRIYSEILEVIKFVQKHSAIKI